MKCKKHGLLEANQTYKEGKRTLCKKCKRNEYQRVWREENIERRIAYRKKYRLQRLKAKRKEKRGS